MLRSAAIPRNKERIIRKSLNTSIRREEAKTPEIETVYVRESVEKIRKFTVDIEEEENAEATEVPSLSKRALKVKESLNKKEEISAVLLKTKGKSEEIKCKMSSKEINKILNGKPTIIGELEEIGVIIVRSLQQSKYSSADVNPNTLPPPFCSQKYCGNYLLLRIDANGNAKNFSLKEYEQFVKAKKAGIEEEMKKNSNSAEDKPIKAQTDSKLRMVYLQSELDKTKSLSTLQSLSEFDDCKSVSVAVDDLVNKISNNKMIDPDYDPNEDESIDPDYAPTKAEENEAEIEKEALNNLRLEQSDVDWRLELEDALTNVREQAKIDGALLAERICDSFYESNGVEPSLAQLVDIFAEIKSNLYETNDSEIVVQKRRETVRFSSKENSLQMFKTAIVKSKTGASDSYNVYFDKAVSDERKRKNLRKAIESFEMRNGREPTLFEIARLKKFLSTNDETKEVKFRLVVVEESDNGSEEKEEKYDLCPQSQKGKTVKATVLVSPVKTKKNGSSAFKVYFDAEKAKAKKNKTETQKANVWFERFNNRKPTKAESESIERFLESDSKEQLTECQYNIPLANKAQKSAIDYATDSIVEKKSSTKYVLNFESKEARSGDNAQAIQWFKRFNNREPTEIEKQNIKEFVQNDEQDTIDID